MRGMNMEFLLKLIVPAGLELLLDVKLNVKTDLTGVGSHNGKGSDGNKNGKSSRGQPSCITAGWEGRRWKSGVQRCYPLQTEA